MSSGEAGVYLYGLCPSSAAGAPLHSEGVLAGSGVEFLVCGQLAAAASSVTLEEFAPAQVEARLKRGEVLWVEEKAFAHGTVLQELMQRGPVVPVRFGTIFRDADRLLSLLAERGRELGSLLVRLAGKMEWGVKAHCRREALKEVLVKEDPETLRLQEPLRRMSPGTAYLQRRKLEPLLGRLLQERLDEWAGQIHEVLARASAASEALEVPGGAEGEETALLNGAYLVPEEGTNRFREELARLGVEFASRGLWFVLSGPWPPYHFARFDLGGEETT